MSTLSELQETFIVGQVKSGRQIGKKLGFPTANLNLLGEINLEKGVYGVYVYLYQRKYFGMMNIGNRPTFNDGNHQTVEVHILDFNEDIYDKYLAVEIAFFIRKEKKFNSVKDLKEHIKEDISYARSQFRLVAEEGNHLERV